jgi:hypothetical protein
MKTRTFAPLPLLLLLCAFATAPASAQDKAATASIEAILVEASNAGSGVDRSLARYAGTLERLFKFDSYRRIGGKRFRIDLPGEGGGGIGNGSTLAIEARTAGGNALNADLQWSQGGRTLLHTRVNLRRGTPTVLGGPRSTSGDGNYLLIVVWR